MSQAEPKAFVELPKLTSEHDCDEFNSGADELDDWLKERALNSTMSGKPTLTWQLRAVNASLPTTRWPLRVWPTTREQCQELSADKRPTRSRASSLQG